MEITLELNAVPKKYDEAFKRHLPLSFLGLFHSRPLPSVMRTLEEVLLQRQIDRAAKINLSSRLGRLTDHLRSVSGVVPGRGGKMRTVPSWSEAAVRVCVAAFS